MLNYSFKAQCGQIEKSQLCVSGRIKTDVTTTPSKKPPKKPVQQILQGLIFFLIFCLNNLKDVKIILILILLVIY